MPEPAEIVYITYFPTAPAQRSTVYLGYEGTVTLSALIGNDAWIGYCTAQNCFDEDPL